MIDRKYRVVCLWIFTGASIALSGCAQLNSSFDLSDSLPRTQADYERAGNEWGSRLRQAQKEPATNLTNDYKIDVCRYVTQKDIDNARAKENFNANNETKNTLDWMLVRDLFWRVDYFKVHSDLKDSFKKGFRLGFQDRIADLVLGPHITTTAACKGMSTSQDFVKVIEEFEKGWDKTLGDASKTFIVLISEGSQADRNDFTSQFVAIYGAKWNDNDKKKKGGVMRRMSEGGTALYIDMSKGAAGVVMDIPHHDELKKELYTQAFTVMGDELGRRYSTNLIKRDELVDLLRRIKPVLSEVVGVDSRENLARISDAFNEAYTADKDAFRSMVRDAGIDVALLQTSSATAPPASSGAKKK